jgi:hypothetical protein
MSLNVWIAVAIAAIAVVGMFWNYLPSLATVKGWIPALGKAKATKPTPEDALKAIRLLCKYTKGDAESEAAINTLKQRFLLVPGAAE